MMPKFSQLRYLTLKLPLWFADLVSRLAMKLWFAKL